MNGTVKKKIFLQFSKGYCTYWLQLASFFFSRCHFSGCLFTQSLQMSSEVFYEEMMMMMIMIVMDFMACGCATMFLL
jgi:hypothetical protein